MQVDPDSLLAAMIVLTVLGGYICVSLFFLKFPLILHKKKKVPFRCRHISHRGGAGEQLENTMAAFQHACEMGTEMFELDCHITKDSQVVVSHDNCLLRTTGNDSLISETLYKDLPQLKPRLKLDFYSKWETEGCDRQITLLRDVFEKFPHMPINIDIKIDNDELIQEVSKLVTEYNRTDITVWGNRSSVVAAKCKNRNPNIHLLVSVRRCIKLVLLFYSGLLPFVPIEEDFYEIIMPSILLKPEKFHTQFGWKFRLLVRVCDFLLMSKCMFEHLEKRGIQTYLWVLNEDDEFEQAFKMGATGVMTDFPSKLAAFLEKRPQYQ